MTPTPTTTHNYAYNNSAWGDQLTSYNGQSIAYDAIGNPTTYYNGTQYSNMTWEQGRNLTFLMMGLSYVSFEYNDQGIRTSKTLSNGTTYNYILDGTRIVAETWDDELLIFLYDDNGSPIGMQSRYSGYAENEFDTYWFEKNLQGDIIAVYNENGTKLVEYTYDAWGNFTTTYCNGGENDYALDFNPFRYRGYYYDEETGFYYLKSRYYDPVTGRFINADGYISTGTGLLGYNMYAYCSNNPVIYSDPDGESIIFSIAVLVSIGIAPLVIVFGSVAGDVLSSTENFEDSNELYNSNRNKHEESPFVEKSLWYEVEGSSNGTSGSIEASVGLDKGTYSWKYFEMEAGTAKVSAGASTSITTGIGANATAESVYGMVAFKIPIFGHQLKIGVKGNAGSIGGVFSVGAKTEIGIAYGVGGSIIVEWE